MANKLTTETVTVNYAGESNVTMPISKTCAKLVISRYASPAKVYAAQQTSNELDQIENILW